MELYLLKLYANFSFQCWPFCIARTVPWTKYDMDPNCF